MQRRIEQIITLLSQHPYAGPLSDDPRLRYITTTPYLIFYEVAEAEGEIVIIAVRHGSRDPSSMPGQS